VNTPTPPAAHPRAYCTFRASWQLQLKTGHTETPTIAYAGDSPNNGLAGVDDLGAVSRTTDGGRTWTNQSVRLPFKYATGYHTNCPCVGPIYGRPVFDGANGAMPVLLPAGHLHDTLAFYRTADDGEHWTLASTLHTTSAALEIEIPRASRQPTEPEPLVSIADPQTWWVADLTRTDSRTHFRILITRNRGRTWTTTPSNLPLGTTSLDTTDATSAWATTEIYGANDGIATELEQTTDGGRQWSTTHLP
jgi:photosystem II stability/assembly factor-like uncharacterized protein